MGPQWKSAAKIEYYVYFFFLLLLFIFSCTCLGVAQCSHFRFLLFHPFYYFACVGVFTNSVLFIYHLLLSSVFFSLIHVQVRSSSAAFNPALISGGTYRATQLHTWEKYGKDLMSAYCVCIFSAFFAVGKKLHIKPRF